jgi:hypothetical protein
MFDWLVAPTAAGAAGGLFTASVRSTGICTVPAFVWTGVVFTAGDALAVFGGLGLGGLGLGGEFAKPSLFAGGEPVLDNIWTLAAGLLGCRPTDAGCICCWLLLLLSSRCVVFGASRFSTTCTVPPVSRPLDEFGLSGTCTVADFVDEAGVRVECWKTPARASELHS